MCATIFDYFFDKWKHFEKLEQNTKTYFVFRTRKNVKKTSPQATYNINIHKFSYSANNLYYSKGSSKLARSKIEESQQTQQLKWKEKVIWLM